MKTVLAVDDDYDFLEELGEALAAYDYKIIINPDPNDAIKQIRESRPDCVLFDLKMPKKHGFQFSEELREDRALRRIPAIAMTGFYTSEYDTFLDIFGIRRLLKKPFSPDDAKKMIDSVVK